MASQRIAGGARCACAQRPSRGVGGRAKLPRQGAPLRSPARCTAPTGSSRATTGATRARAPRRARGAVGGVAEGSSLAGTDITAAGTTTMAPAKRGDQPRSLQTSQAPRRSSLPTSRAPRRSSLPTSRAPRRSSLPTSRRRRRNCPRPEPETPPPSSPPTSRDAAGRATPQRSSPYRPTAPRCAAAADTARTGSSRTPSAATCASAARARRELAAPPPPAGCTARRDSRWALTGATRATASCRWPSSRPSR